jgi:hypothetical protein
MSWGVRTAVVGHRHSPISIALGPLAAAGLLLSSAGPVAAEWRVDTTIAPPPVMKPRAPARRPKAEPPAEESPEATLPERPAADAAEEEERDGDKEEAREAAAPPVPGASDGNAGSAGEPREPQDGIIVVGEPTAARDGIADRSQDPRLAEDIAAFTSPPAGYDPYLYQIELNPLTDRRTRELFYIEPYFARGIRVGSFVVFPEAQIGVTGTNNIFRNGARLSDGALEVAANVRAVSDWRRHAVEVRASGLATFYDHFPTEDDRSYAFEARGRLDISKRTNIEVLGLHQVDKDRRSQRDSPTDAAQRGDVETDRAAFAVNHTFNRLSLQLRGSLSDVEYAPVTSTSGGIISNAARDWIQREVAFRTSWALNNRIDVFAEAAANDREYRVAADDGILRSSTGERYRLGVVFGPQNNTLRGEVSAGWGWQAPRDGRLSTIEGFIVDANLAWRASALTTFLLTARSDFIDTTTTGSLGALSRQVSLEARHGFRSYLFGTAGIRYTVNPYNAITINERELTTELGLEYYLSRDAILFARYQHIEFLTTVVNSNYADDIVRVGLRVRQ